MLVISVLLTMTGCYSKQIGLLRNELYVLNGKVSALKAETEGRFKREGYYSDDKFDKLFKAVNTLQNSVIHLIDFKVKHNSRWPSLVPKEKR